MPTLRHATLRKNMPSIEHLGLLCCKSQGRLKVCWLHASSKSSWAAIHTIRRHGGRVQDVVVLEVNVPRSWLRRSRRGLWYSTRDIMIDRIKKAITFAELSASPVDATDPNS